MCSLPGLKEVLEATLWLQEVCNRNEVLLANRGKLPNAILNLEQRPELGVHRQAADLSRVARTDTPTAWAGSEDVQECRTVNRNSLFSLG